VNAGAAQFQLEAGEPGVDARLGNERVCSHFPKIVPNRGPFEKRPRQI
jgi:hypothetical protein